MEKEKENTQQQTQQQTSSKKAKEVIVARLQEMFAVQYTYGKTPEDLKLLMVAMIEDLQGFTPDLINEAFTQWRKTSPRIPTPADIIKICQELMGDDARQAKFKTLMDFGGDWEAYKKYAIESGFWVADTKGKQP